MNHGPTLRVGAAGADVKRLQRLFVEMKALAYTDIDGYFGSRTEQAVKEFQESDGLTADGVVGPLTWAALPTDPHTPQLAQGAHGQVVVSLQMGLRIFGGAESPTDPGPADGAFGPRTRSAVLAYQREHGLAADGIVGDLTWWVPAGAAGATLASLARLVTV